ncbi:MAG TPA: hypothetical protein VF309_08485, partial [Usitatibacter sp.]
MAAAAQPLENLEPVHARQAEIEDHEVVLLREQDVVGLDPVAHAIDREAAVAQRFLQPGGQRPVVFRKKDSQGCSRGDSTGKVVAQMLQWSARERSLKGRGGKNAAQTRTNCPLEKRMKKVSAVMALAVMSLEVLAQAPAGYPADYAQTIAAARKEGKVVIYSALDTKAAQPLIKDFNVVYPDVK